MIHQAFYNQPADNQPPIANLASADNVVDGQDQIQRPNESNQPRRQHPQAQAQPPIRPEDQTNQQSSPNSPQGT